MTHPLPAGYLLDPTDPRVASQFADEQRRREEAERLLGKARAEIERLKRGD